MVGVTVVVVAQMVVVVLVVVVVVVVVRGGGVGGGGGGSDGGGVGGGGGGGEIDHHIKHGMAATQPNALGKHITLICTAICAAPPLPLNDHRIRSKHDDRVLHIAHEQRENGLKILFPMVQNKKVAYGNRILNTPPAREM